MSYPGEENFTRSGVEDAITASIKFILNKDGVTKIDHEDDLVDTLGADTLDIVDIVTNVEDKLGIFIPEEACDKMHKVRDLIDVSCLLLNNEKRLI